ncbi:MAG: hypothetical protein ACK6BU_10160 [Cyanobacteriota bacterium]
MSSRPIQTEPRVACCSSGAAPTPSITTSTPSLWRRTRRFSRWLVTITRPFWTPAAPWAWPTSWARAAAAQPSTPPVAAKTASDRLRARGRTWLAPPGAMAARYR